MFIIIPCVELVSSPPVTAVALSIPGNDFITSPRATHIIGVVITPNLVILPIYDFVIPDAGLLSPLWSIYGLRGKSFKTARAIVKNNIIPKEFILDSHLNAI